MRQEKQVKIKKTALITEGVIWKQILFYFFPILFGTFFQQLYNTADAVIVGKFVSKQALAAVGGATGTIINIFVSIFVGLSAGTTVIVAQRFGADDKDGLQKAVHSSIALSIAAGLVMTAVGIAAAPYVLKKMNTPDAVFDFAVTYMRVYFSGTIPTFLYNIGSGILRAVGDTKRPLYFLIAACISNIVLDILFISVFKMGVFGAGLATVIATTISSVLILVSLTRSSENYRVDWTKIRLHLPTLGKILKVGIPAGIQSSMYSISNLIIQSAINSFGTNTMAAMTAFSKIDSFFWMVLGAYGVSITTFAGQNFGAQKYDRIRKSVRVCLLLGFGTSIFVSLLFYAAGPTLFSLFSDDGQVIKLGMEIMQYMVPFYFAFVCIEIFSGAARGCGSTLVPTLMTLGGICVFRVIWVMFLLPHSNTLGTLLISYPVSWSLTSLLFIIYYLQGGWLRNRIKKLGYKPEIRQKKHIGRSAEL